MGIENGKKDLPGLAEEDRKAVFGGEGVMGRPGVSMGQSSKLTIAKETENHGGPTLGGASTFG